MRPTREGKRFLLATLLIAVAAINTGNNLIYLIFAMMLSILVISIVVLNLNLSGLILSFSIVHPVFTKSRSVMTISLTNNKRFLPSYSLHINAPKGVEGQCTIPHIPASSQLSITIEGIFSRRGIYRYGDFFMESSFPFILFKKIKRLPFGGEVIVYPEIKEIDKQIPESFESDYSPFITRHGTGEEFVTIREFRYGDSTRRIQWKASAKTGKLMVKDTARDEPKLLTIILDNIRPLDKASFEKAVSFAASLAYRFIMDGFFVRLMTCKKLIPFGSGQEHLYKILDVLSLIDEDDTWDCPMTHEMQGACTLILKSDNSSLKKIEHICNMVIYASDL